MFFVKAKQSKAKQSKAKQSLASSILYFKKAQAALEFLTTYGWAFMIILVMVGALSYFGVLDPSSFVSDRCVVGSPFSCEEFIVGEDGFLLTLRNGFGEGLVVTSFWYFDESGERVSCNSFDEFFVSGGGVVSVGCAFSESSGVLGSGGFGFRYRSVSDSSGSFARNINGDIRVSGVEDGGVLDGADVLGIVSCPDGFVFVSGSSYFNTSGFCVMRWEAKAFDTNTGEIVLDGCDSDCNAGDWATSDVVPVSVPEGKPWRRIRASHSSGYDAVNACESQGWRLINNREWMTIARQIEQNPSNWLDGVVGSSQPNGGLIRGNSDGVLRDGSDELSGLNRRTFYLENGGVIWDFAGNLWNWVDVLEDGSSFSGDICSGNHTVWRGFSGDSVGECVFTSGTHWSKNSSSDVRFEVGPLGDYNAEEQRVGRIFPRNSPNIFARRGGAWSSGVRAGVFALDLSRVHTAGGAYADPGFRCVVSPGS